MTLFFVAPLISSADEKKRDIEYMPDILEIADEGDIEGIFFSSQNEQKMKVMEEMLSKYSFQKSTLFSKDGTLNAYLNKKAIEIPIIEYKRINHTKYRIRVHRATEDFPIIFSEAYHEGWKAYVSNSYKPEVNDQKMTNQYKILDGNKGDQANIDELKTYISNGWVSTLGAGDKKERKHKRYNASGRESIDHVETYYIDFISKNFRETIQNNNLPSGASSETWFKRHVSDDLHWKVNGCINSWWILLDDIKQCGKYIENSDGSIDFELILEFWPQRLFGIGLLISGTTVLVCISYLLYYRANKFYS